MDVCQSVLASFFVHVAIGAYVLHEPRQLVALLTKMAQNKLNMRARASIGIVATSVVSQPRLLRKRTWFLTLPGPLRQAAGKELLDRTLAMMTPEIRAIAVRRMRDEAWADIASALGGTAEGAQTVRACRCPDR